MISYTVELEQVEPIKELRVVLLGSRYVGKSAVLKTLLGDKVSDSGKRTTSSMVHEGDVNQTLIKVVDTPGWLRSLNVKDTTEHVKQEIMRSVFLCPPGPHVFLLVIDTEASFTGLQHDVVDSHLRLLGEDLWRHLIVVFSKGDWLREETIEEHIEVEGEALSCLINKCGNRYHILRNQSIDTEAQASELLCKMKELVAENNRNYFHCDENVFKIIEDKRRLVKQRSKEKTEAIRRQRGKGSKY